MHESYMWHRKDSPLLVPSVNMLRTNGVCSLVLQTGNDGFYAREKTDMFYLTNHGRLCSSLLTSSFRDFWKTIFSIQVWKLFGIKVEYFLDKNNFSVAIIKR